MIPNSTTFSASNRNDHFAYRVLINKVFTLLRFDGVVRVSYGGNDGSSYQLMSCRHEVQPKAALARQFTKSRRTASWTVASTTLTVQLPTRQSDMNHIQKSEPRAKRKPNDGSSAVPVSALRSSNPQQFRRPEMFRVLIRQFFNKPIRPSMASSILLFGSGTAVTAARGPFSYPPSSNAATKSLVVNSRSPFQSPVAQVEFPLDVVLILPSLKYRDEIA